MQRSNPVNYCTQLAEEFCKFAPIGNKFILTTEELSAAQISEIEQYSRVRPTDITWCTDTYRISCRTVPAGSIYSRAGETEHSYLTTDKEITNIRKILYNNMAVARIGMYDDPSCQIETHRKFA